MSRVSNIQEKYKDEDVELEVVAYVLRKDSSLASEINPEWFSNAALASIIKTMKEIHTPLSQELLLVYLRKKRSLENEEIYKSIIKNIYRLSLPPAKSIKITIDSLIDLFEKRRMISEVSKVISNIKSDKFDVVKSKEILRAIVLGVERKDKVELGSYTKGLKKRIEIVKKRAEYMEFSGVATGIQAFDSITGGLLAPEFGVIVGRPGVGKSAMLSSFAIHAWKNEKNVLYVSGEMPKEDVEFRMDSSISEILASKFRMGNMKKEEMERWEMIVEKEEITNKGILEIASFPRNFTIADIEGILDKLETKYEKHIDLVCLDYINIMGSSTVVRGTSKDWQAQAEIVWEVKSMCSDLKLCLWTAGQLRDEAIDSDVLSVEDVKYSRAISETAPIIIGLITTIDQDLEQSMELQVLKLRNSPLPDRSIILRPNLNIMKIHEEILPTIKDLRYIDKDLIDISERRKKKAIELSKRTGKNRH